MTINADIQSLAPGKLVTLFELDISPITKTNTPDDHLYFHAGTNELSQPVVWQGNTYQPFPIKVEGFEMTTKGTLPRPTMAVANVSGILWPMMKDYDDLVGAIVTRRRTYARYLDVVNFPAIRNRLIHTNAFNQTVWTKANFTVAAVGDWWQPTESVDGGPLGHNIRQILASGDRTVSWVVSIRAKYVDAARRYIRVHCSSTSTADHGRCVFDTLTGQITETITTGATTGTLGTTEPDGEGGWRFTVRATPTNVAGTGVLMEVYLMAASTGTAVYQGTGMAGPLLRDAQMEQASVATPYQPIGAVSSPNPTADPNQYLPDDVYYVERKVAANKQQASWELASAMDLEGVKLPGRDIIVGFCPWEYRSAECSYAGSNYFDANGNPVGSLSLDVCSKAVDTGCKKRFVNTVLPFGGFPAARAYKF